MAGEYLIDTNIIIYYLNNDIPAGQLAKVEQILRESFIISTITKIEVLGWKALQPADMSKIELFFSSANVIFVDESIQNKTIEIKQQHNIKTPDAIIGATAALFDLTIATRNEKDFKNINGLKIYNPFEKKP